VSKLASFDDAILLTKMTREMAVKDENCPVGTTTLTHLAYTSRWVCVSRTELR